jgi:ubiquinone/menaquinone biosynthesis C-methylase UbiE
MQPPIITPTSTPPHPPSLYQRFQAKLLSSSERTIDKLLGPKKAHLFSHLNRANGIQTVLEIGIGTAPNFKYYGNNVVNIIGLDPSTAIIAYANQKAEEQLSVEKGGGKIEDATTTTTTTTTTSPSPPPSIKSRFQLIIGKAEAIPLPDNSCDAVVGTHVMCSVTDLEKSITEINRVLRPGGKYIFLDHIAAEPESTLFTIQRTITPAWKLVANGCHLTRRPLPVIKAVFGEENVEAEEYRAGPAPAAAAIFSPTLAGVATKV